MRGRTRLVALALIALAAAPVHAACTPPAAPEPATRPEKPALPAKGPCVGAPIGTAGCLGWEANRYNDDIRAYNEKAAAFQKAAQAYVDKLNHYVAASADYARCEVKTLQ